ADRKIVARGQRLGLCEHLAFWPTLFRPQHGIGIGATGVDVEEQGFWFGGHFWRSGILLLPPLADTAPRIKAGEVGQFDPPPRESLDGENSGRTQRLT